MEHLKVKIVTLNSIFQRQRHKAPPSSKPHRFPKYAQTDDGSNSNRSHETPLPRSSITERPIKPPRDFFLHHNPLRQVVRVETLGVVVSRERRDKFLKFLVDDGSGVIQCILWLNHHLILQNSDQRPFPRHVARMQPSDIELMAEMAAEDVETVQLGAVFRVRGQVGVYMGQKQITVRDVLEERDPNAEILHLVDCIRLAKSCYD